MAWVICEGLDRVGKSTVAELYKRQGFQVIHMSAPNKKYKQPGYSGPSYLDEILDMLMEHDGKDVFWDRSWYGESSIWPHVYGREPALSEDELEILQEYEERNEALKILMTDPNTEAHWKRCVENNEPLTHPQFRLANSLYAKLAHKYNFVPKQLSDFNHDISKPKAKNDEQISNVDSEVSENTKTNNTRKDIVTSNISIVANTKPIHEKNSGLERLEKANAISAILSKRLIKQRGDAFDELEGEVTDFLKGRLEELLGAKKASTPSFAEEEIEILKVFCKRLMEKEKESQSVQTNVSKTSINRQPIRR
jgi:hypothetical protein